MYFMPVTKNKTVMNTPQQRAEAINDLREYLFWNVMPYISEGRQDAIKSHLDKVEKAISEEVAAPATSLPDWIGVKDALPNDGERVIVYAPSDAPEDIYVDYMINKQTSWDYGIIVGKDNEYKGWAVTHWMPLPAPPSEASTAPEGGQTGVEAPASLPEAFLNWQIDNRYLYDFKIKKFVAAWDNYAEYTTAELYQLFTDETGVAASPQQGEEAAAGNPNSLSGIVEELREADATLEKDGYNSWCYTRLAITKAIHVLTNKKEIHD